MSNAIFPTLPGLKWGVRKTPVWHTKVQTSASGREQRACFYSYPLWRYSLSYEVLRAHDARGELQTLVGFFNARQGSFDSFLYRDPTDCRAHNQPFGVVQAGRNTYQLARTLGGFVEPVQTVDGTPTLYANGTALTVGKHYAMTPQGVVTLTEAVAVGSTLSWSGAYFWRVRFLHDSAEFEQFYAQLWAAKKIEFQTIKL